ncbi:MAG: hypothetical protein FWG63_10275 [Defluviitaleaceae bacterium]|nr:hypothetical protein [Defluviitaleaceae bacterium]
MEIKRAEINDMEMFTAEELNFGACCFFTEDRTCKYFFKINKREATLFTNTKQYINEVIKEFLFYSNFILSIKDEDGCVLFVNSQSQPYLFEISKIQPSQFYINEKKLENCKKWIKHHDDIFIPITIKDGKCISLDGHTRLRAALDFGYTSVFVYLDEYDEYIFYFVDEAIKQQIFSISDMELLSDDEYKLKWHKFCDDFFNSLP